MLASQVIVSGDIKAESAAFLIVAGAYIAGNIEVKESESGKITQAQVEGNILLEANTGSFELGSNWLDGNLQAFKNRGALTLTDNVIEGNLQCKENSPAPNGVNNIVHGNLEDQCANLGS